jgi:ferric-dicitrate binding protein FerR (iron transport regulator)
MNKNIEITKEEKRAIVNYLTNEFSTTDSKILNRWLEKSEGNKLIFDQFSAIWLASSHNNLSKQIDSDKAWNDLQNRINIHNKKTRSTVWNEILRIAAVFVIALFLGGLGYHFLDKGRDIISEPLFVEYFSPLGSRSFVQLADGSKVWLNAGSTLKYQNTFGTNNREIILSGEAFFEVKKNKDLPFVVKTSEIDIIALGTKFNVKAYCEEKTIETTLIEGSVKLESTSVKLSDDLFLKPNEKAVFTKKSQTVELIANQKQNIDQAKLEQVKPKLEIIQSVEPEPIISWKEKRWVINNEKLGNLAVKLERRYDVNFIFDNDVLKEYAFRGTLEDETLEQIMEAIKLTAPVKYVIDKKTVYVMADGQQMKKFKNLIMK